MGKKFDKLVARVRTLEEAIANLLTGSKKKTAKKSARKKTKKKAPARKKSVKPAPAKKAKAKRARKPAPVVAPLPLTATL